MHASLSHLGFKCTALCQNTVSLTALPQGASLQSARCSILPRLPPGRPSIKLLRLFNTCKGVYYLSIFVSVRFGLSARPSECVSVASSSGFVSSERWARTCSPSKEERSPSHRRPPGSAPVMKAPPLWGASPPPPPSETPSATTGNTSKTLHRLSRRTRHIPN